MEVAKIKISGTTDEVSDLKTITSGMVGATVSITYDNTWDGLNKQVVFRTPFAAINADGATIPHELLKLSGVTLKVGVYGYTDDGTIVIPTVYAELGRIKPGADPGGDEAAKPTNPMWMEAITTARNADGKAEDALEAAVSAERKADSASDMAVSAAEQATAASGQAEAASEAAAAASEQAEAAAAAASEALEKATAAAGKAESASSAAASAASKADTASSAAAAAAGKADALEQRLDQLEASVNTGLTEINDLIGGES